MCFKGTRHKVQGPRCRATNTSIVNNCEDIYLRYEADKKSFFLTCALYPVSCIVQYH